MFWKEKWAEMSWFRRVLLVLMAAMILFFGAATAAAGTREGYAYGGTLLRAEREGDARRYTGQVEGVDTELVISGEGVVTLRKGEDTYGPYQVVKAPEAAAGMFKGIEIHQGGLILFRGSYTGGASPSLRDESGEPVLETRMSMGASGGNTHYYIGGQEVSQKEWNTPSLGQIARWALEPEELTHRGDLGLYLLITLLALFNLVQLCFPDFFFRLSLWGHVRDPERAEPSDLYIAMEHVEWVVLAVICAVLYYQALTVIN